MFRDLVVVSGNHTRSESFFYHLSLCIVCFMAAGGACHMPICNIFAALIHGLQRRQVTDVGVSLSAFNGRGKWAGDKVYILLQSDVGSSRCKSTRYHLQKPCTAEM